MQRLIECNPTSWGEGGNITAIVMTRTILQTINLVGKRFRCGDTVNGCFDGETYGLLHRELISLLSLGLEGFQHFYTF